MILLARPLFAAALLIAPFAAPVDAHAESLDLTQASCADFAAMSESDRTQLSLWLAGYFAGNAMRPLLDLEKIVAAPAALGALCDKSPQAPLIGPETRSIFITAP
ncbi:HdeA/HdeB family chaperone [Bosea sp. Root381]|uniref:HdeA/HdeB family chaperone n=1 Tax=Bosea sp. Root381 TaxID=1736524 RepID=UPI000A86EC4D|nr:HdeA/HdeB family chaperone [Bosea sp. Root381]